MKGTKISDQLYYDERSAGGIVFKDEGRKRLWLVVKAASKGRGWKSRRGPIKRKPVYKFPKGHLRKNEFLKQAALREVEEEGQVKAKILAKIGSNNYVIYDRARKGKIIKKVTFFLMEYESPSRLKYFDAEVILAREWLVYEEAVKKLAYDSEKILLRKARERLKRLKK